MAPNNANRGSTGATFSIRPAIGDDYPRLSRVFEEAEAFHREALPHVFRKPEGLFPPREVYTWMVESDEATLLVAELDGELVGFVTVREESAPDDSILQPSKYAVVDMLAVRRDRQREGTGKALMEATHEWARSRGLTEIELHVWEFNDRAIEFYQPLGYTTAQRVMRRAI